ncbi:MAG: hypothetical protein LBR08_11970 [Bacteroidales bacterium]|nr:hypothetical protein [Bacteroidales bacterium]
MTTGILLSETAIFLSRIAKKVVFPDEVEVDDRNIAIADRKFLDEDFRILFAERGIRCFRRNVAVINGNIAVGDRKLVVFNGNLPPTVRDVPIPKRQ